MSDEAKRFILEHDFLAVHEIAIRLDKSITTIRAWRKELGLSKDKPFKNQPARPKAPIPSITDPEIWDNAEWFEEQYYKNKIGIITISKIINKSPRLVVLRFKKYGIETRAHSSSVRSTHPCSDPAWLYFNYGTKDEYIGWAKKSGIEPDKNGGRALSLRKCADMAKVVPTTIYNWLTRANRDGHKINIRDINESVAGDRNPFYGHKHTDETKERLRKSSSAYLKSRAKNSRQQT